MTRRITGDDLRAFAAAHFPEPYQPRMGSYGHWDAIAATLSHIGDAKEFADMGEAAADVMVYRVTGIKTILGEILGIRAQEDPDPDWDEACLENIRRAEGYLKWAKPLLEPATVVIDQGIKRGETQ